MAGDDSGRYGIPIATYRLQLTPEFTFERAADVVPYLADLGISHVYLSPCMEAVAGSEHGYDVTDHNQVRREIGGIGGLYALNDALIAHGMGLIADFVPNHVGIGSGNAWWTDVLRYGRESPYSHYFDIDWEAQPQMERGVLWYPLLGQTFGRVLEAGELRLALHDLEPAVMYFDNILPVSPAHYSTIFGIPPSTLRDELSDTSALPRLADLLDGLRTAGRDEAELLRGQFREVLEAEPGIREWAEGCCAELNGKPGDSSSFDALETILLDQHYRLADWRVSGEEINYRRFFDQNSLAAIRVERDDVFEEVHRLLFELVRAGIVTGVRIDHIDGLYDPGAYLARLREGLDAASEGLGHVPVFVEKILEPGEELPRWDITGATGYEFLGAATSVLIDRQRLPALVSAFRQFTDERDRFEDVAYEAKLHIAGSAFSGEVNVLAWQLYRIAQRHRLHRDNTLRSLRRAITGTISCFPVYRTYVDDEISGGRQYIHRAVAEAGRRDHSLSPAALALLREVLTLEGDLDDDERDRRIHFRRRFQQLSGPVMAKGVEDTASFRYVPLLALNEVGSSPAQTMPAGEVHRWFEARQAEWPHSLSATSTHDTKRSEDVRARIAVLSEIPAEWRREALAWQRMNERHRQAPGNEPAPDPVTEWYLYQTLVGSWPAAGPDPEYIERISAHMVKAMRESKRATSWLSPNPEYEEAVVAFVHAILHPRRGAAFRRRLQRFVDRIGPAAALNSLSLLTLKCLAPGVPDFYQGAELPFFALTDPDNRRPVDFEWLERALRDLSAEPPASEDHARKLWLTRQLIGIRRSHPATHCGDYEPLRATGPRTDNVLAFARRQHSDVIAVAVPRLALSFLGEEKPWTGTTIDLPSGRWTSLLTGDGGSGGDCESLFERFPIAVLRMEA